MPVSSGLVTNIPAVCLLTAALSASTLGCPVSSSGYRVTTLKPAVAGHAASHGWLKIVVMTSSRCPNSPFSSWYFLMMAALLKAPAEPPGGWNVNASIPLISRR